MRLIQITVLCTALTLPGAALAQSQKVQGASLAGLCAASLEFVAGARSAAGAAQPRELQVLQHTRDLYLGIPKFPAGEVESFANAWSQRMTENVSTAADASKRGAIANEIGTIARDCQQQMVQQVKAARQQGGVLQPQPAQPQPLPAQPLQVQPLETQPLTTQPFVLTPQ